MTDICHQLLDVYCLESTSSESSEENARKISDKNKSSLIDNCANTNFTKKESFISRPIKLSRKKSSPYKKEKPKSLPNHDLKHYHNESNLAKKTGNNFQTVALNRNPDLLDSKFWETLQNIKAVGKASSQGLTNIIIQQNIVTTTCNFQISTLNTGHYASNSNKSLGHNSTGGVYRTNELPNTSLYSYELNSQPSSFSYEVFKTPAEVVAPNSPYNKPLIVSNDLSGTSTSSKILQEPSVREVNLPSAIGQTLCQKRNIEPSRIQPSYPQLQTYSKDMYQTGIQLCPTDVTQNNFAVSTEFSNLTTETVPHNSKGNTYLFVHQTPINKDTDLSYTNNPNLFLPNTEQYASGSRVFEDENIFSCDRNYYQTENRPLESNPFENSYSAKLFHPASEVPRHFQNPNLRDSFHINQDSSSYQVSPPNNFRNDMPNDTYFQNFDTNASFSNVYPEQNYMFEEYFHPEEFSSFPEPVSDPRFFPKPPVFSPSKGLLPSPQPRIREFDYSFDDNSQLY